jgi:hypothetical protein
MNFVLQPWQLLLAILAGWSNRQQQEVSESLHKEQIVYGDVRSRPRSNSAACGSERSQLSG